MRAEIEKTEEAATKSREIFEKENQILQDYDSYKELYNTWKETGEGAEQLKTAAANMGEALGIAGSQALAEKGNFDSLNASIEKSIGLHETLSKTNADAAIRNAESILFRDSGLFSQAFMPTSFAEKYIGGGSGVDLLGSIFSGNLLKDMDTRKKFMELSGIVSVGGQLHSNGKIIQNGYELLHQLNNGFTKADEEYKKAEEALAQYEAEHPEEVGVKGTN